MAYDPRDYGALCDICVMRTPAFDGDQPLADGPFVPPEMNAGSLGLLIGEAPGGEEIEQLRPFVGDAGRELLAGLTSHGVRRGVFSYTNSIMCRPRSNEFDYMMKRWDAKNKKRKEFGLQPLPSPLACCRPRLINEARSFQNIVTTGKRASVAILGIGGGKTKGKKGGGGKQSSILAIRGGPVEGWIDRMNRFIGIPPPGTPDHDNFVPPMGGTHHRVLPTVHPSFVMRARKWTMPFRSDLGRALRWFSGQMRWLEPRTGFNPSAEELYRFLSRPSRFVVYDVETDSKEPLTAALRCIGFARCPGEDGVVEAVCVGILGIDGEERFYPEPELARILDVCRWFFRNPSILKVGHNAASYDRMVVEHHLGVTPEPLVDTLPAYHAVASELPHDLGFIGSLYCDVNAWKSTRTATTANDNEELHIYCLKDCAVNSTIVTPITKALEARNQVHVAKFRRKLMDVCVEMHKNGILVDIKAARVHELQEQRKILDQRDRMRKACGIPDLNPNSIKQLRSLLFEKFAFDVVEETKLGDPSTADKVIRHLMFLPGTTSEQRTTLDALRRYRSASKLLGTYITKMRPQSERIDRAWIDEDETEEDKDNPDDAKFGVIWPDGRVRANWNANGSSGWRWSSSGPNMQNQTGNLKDMYVAAPGNLLVKCDMDQVEFRFVAALSDSPRYLEVFRKGGDAHAVTAEFMYGNKFLQAEKTVKKKLRRTGKTLRFGMQYGASIDTVHQVWIATEDDNGDLPYAHVTLEEARILYTRILEGDPALPAWWESEIDLYRKRGFLEEPVLGMRRDFLNGEERNEILNFRCQSGASAIVHLSMMDFRRKYPFECWGPRTGIIAQVHDEILVECPETIADKVASDLKESMTRTIPGLDVPFTATAEVCKRDAQGQSRWSYAT